MNSPAKIYNNYNELNHGAPDEHRIHTLQQIESLKKQSRLKLGDKTLGHFLGDALSYGYLTEWGMPWGGGGRAILQCIIAEATKQYEWCLWIQDRKDVMLYAPSWHAAGIDLSRLRSVHWQSDHHKAAQGKHGHHKQKPQGLVDDLKALFMSSFFKVIVIDSHISAKDYVFLAKRARLQGQLIFVVRDHLLSSNIGNVWAKNRINCWSDHLSERLYLKAVKGKGAKQLSLRYPYSP